jgi:hypothetical protein
MTTMKIKVCYDTIFWFCYAPYLSATLRGAGPLHTRVILNSEEIKPTLIITLITDTILPVTIA